MSNSSKILWVIVAIVVIVGLVWWVTSMSSSTVMPADTSTSTATSTSQTTATTTNSAVPGDNVTLGEDSNQTLGTYLVAYNGMTLYTYSPDRTNVSNCTGQCAVNWPPYTVASTANLVGESPIAGTLHTIVRADGSTQVTYNGHPLYFYIQDKNPGDTTGQGVGGVWYVVKP
jgi:predicted lipoprotein with Yx(FWY)xxD motif